MFNILIFEAIYKLAVFLLVKPLFKGIVLLFREISGYDMVLNGEIAGFLSSIFGIIMLIILLILGVVFVYFEFAVILVFMAKGARNVKATVGYAIRAAISTFPSLKHISTVGFAVYSLALIPYLNIGVHSSLLPKVKIPNFVTGEILKYNGGWILLFLILVVAMIVFLKLVLTLPIMVLEQFSFSKSVKKGLLLAKGNIIQIALAVILAALPAMTLIPALGAETLTASIIDFLSTPIILAVILTVYLQLNKDTPELNEDDVEKIEYRLVTYKTKLMQDISKFVASIKSVIIFVYQTKLPQPIKKRPYILLIFLLAPIICVFVAIGQYYYNPFSDMPCIVVGHRGSAEGVENSIQAIESAIAQGADYVEIDILLSVDNVPMVVHDSNLFRLTGRSINVYDQTADDITAITIQQNGYEGQISTLDEICRAAKDKIGLFIELKSHGHEAESVADKAVEIVKQNDMVEVCMFQSSDMALVLEVHEKYPEFRTGYIVIGEIGGLSPGQIKELPFDILAFEEAAITQPLISSCHRAGKQIYVWTVNEAAEMERVFQMKIDGIVSDYPKEVKRMITGSEAE